MKKFIILLVPIIVASFQMAPPKSAFAIPMSYTWETVQDYGPSWNLNSLRFIYDADHYVPPSGGKWSTYLETYVNGVDTPEYFYYEEEWLSLSSALNQGLTEQEIVGIPYVQLSDGGSNYYLEFLDHALSDANYGFIEQSWAPGYVVGYQLVDVAPVPEPATVLLFATGIAGLMINRRKFQRCKSVS